MGYCAHGITGPRIGLLEGPSGRQGAAILETDLAVWVIWTLERYVWPYPAFCAASLRRANAFHYCVAFGRPVARAPTMARARCEGACA